MGSASGQNCSDLGTDYFMGLMGQGPKVLGHWPFSCLLFISARYIHRTNRRASVHLSATGVHCDHIVQFSVDLSLRLDSPMFWALWHQSMFT